MMELAPPGRPVPDHTRVLLTNDSVREFLAIVFSVSKCQYLQGSSTTCGLTEFTNQLKMRHGFSLIVSIKWLQLDRCLYTC
jgi:hypothetical protein